MLIELTKENSMELLGCCLGRFHYCSFASLDLKYNEPVPEAASWQPRDPASQYAAIRTHILERKMAAIYAGLVAYYDSKNHRRYTAYTYSAFVRHPGVYRKTESFDLGTLAALDAQRFDLNGYFKRAIPYLNKREEERLREELHKYATVDPAQRAVIFHEDDSVIRKYLKSKRIQKLILERCHEVTEWLKLARPGESLVLEGTDYRDTMGFYFLRKTVLGLFRTVWASTKDFKMCIDNVLCMRRGKYETDEFKTMKPEGFVVDALTTFRKLIRHVLAMDIPVVGHDLLLALMVIYNQVEEELPDTYEGFVSALAMRGRPIDTRRLAAAMSAECRPAVDRPDSLDLEPMVRYLRNGAGLAPTCESRYIVIVPDPNGRVEVEDDGVKFAGKGDAFKAGYLYVKLEYYLTERGIAVTPLFASRPAGPSDRKSFHGPLESLPNPFESVGRSELPGRFKSPPSRLVSPGRVESQRRYESPSRVRDTVNETECEASEPDALSLLDN